MIKKLQKSTLLAALRMGGFTGWYLTVMYICEQSLRFYRDDSMLAHVNQTFLIGSVASAAVLAAILLIFDIEGVLADKILRWLPGVFMAESGIALSLANASTMSGFAAVAGVASAFGALAIMTQLLRVKVGQRMFAISLGLALGGLVRLIAALLIGGSVTKAGLMAAAIIIGVLAALVVHSEGYSAADGPLISLAEAEPRTIIKKIPNIYIVMFLCSVFFYFAHTHIEGLVMSKITDGYSGYAAIASVGFVAAAVIAAFLIKLPLLPMLFVFGSGLSAAGAMLAGLPYLTPTEAGFFAFVSYGALVCVQACFYLMIVIFSLDRPHPLFYAFFGYMVEIAGRYAGLLLDEKINSMELNSYIWLLVLLMPIGGGMLAYGIKRYGFTQDKLDHRHNMRALIRRRSAELSLTEREQQMTESIVLDGCDINALASKMLFSRNTVNVLLRSMLPKFKVEDIDELRDYFSKETDSEEKFIAEVHAAEDERRAADRVEQAKHRKEERERRREAKAERKAAEQKELEERAANMHMIDIILGNDDSDEAAAEEAYPADSAEDFDEISNETPDDMLEENSDEAEEKSENMTEETYSEDAVSDEIFEDEAPEASDETEEDDDESENADESDYSDNDADYDDTDESDYPDEGEEYSDEYSDEDSEEYDEASKDGYSAYFDDEDE